MRTELSLLAPEHRDGSHAPEAQARSHMTACLASGLALCVAGLGLVVTGRPLGGESMSSAVISAGIGIAGVGSILLVLAFFLWVALSSERSRPAEPHRPL